jgi:hypothetical protein
MLWHLIDNRGKIVQSVTARSKPEAQAVLGAGTVVSDVSWQMDKHLWQPVETIVSGNTQRKAKNNRYPPLPRDYYTTEQVAQKTGLKPRRIRHLVDQFQLRIRQFDRGRFGFTDAQIRKLMQLDRQTDMVFQSSIIAKRREGLLARLRLRYLAKAEARKQIVYQ